MNTIMNNPFVCECCGTTAPRFDEEFTVTLIGHNGVIYKKVCFDCLLKFEQNDPRYLCKTSRYLDPKLQAYMDSQEKEWNEQYEHHKMKFLKKHKDCTLVKNIIGTRHYEGLVDVTDPCYGSGSYEGKRLPVATGDYTCAMWNLNFVHTFEGVDYHISEMDTMGIYLNGKIPAHDDMIEVGCACVDSGLIGIFDVNENLNLSEWLDNKLADKNNDLDSNAMQDIGFMVSRDDGGSQVWVAIEHGQIVAVEIRLSDYIHRGQ